MTTTDRALRAAQALIALGDINEGVTGLRQGAVVTARALTDVFKTCNALELAVPEPLADGLERVANQLSRLKELQAPSPPFTAADLAADDYPARFIAALSAELLVEHAPKALKSIRDELTATARDLIRSHVPDLIDMLNTRWPDHARTETATRGPILGAYGTLLAWRPSGRPLSYQGEWCLHWQWTQRAWNRLVEATGPNMTIHKDSSVYDVAIGCGGVPHLAPHKRDAEERAEQHHQAWELWRDHNRVERIQAHAQRAYEASVAEAQAEVQRDAQRARKLADLLALSDNEE